MTIKDLEYIHSLLIEDVKTRKKAWDILKEALHEAEETNADNYKALLVEEEKAHKNYNKASNVSSNFELEEWKL